MKWLIPGIRVKRWILVLFVGITILSLGFGLFLLNFFRAYPKPAIEYVITLGWSALWFRALLAGVIGISLILLALIRLNRAILAPLDVSNSDVIDAMVSYRQRQKGPRIVAIGGGTGLPTLLRGLKRYTSNITAIVTVADDGGSSGRLRRDLGVLPPGDFRNNIAALARDEGLMTQLFQYRFGEGGLEGHSFGNLFITALSSVTGSFEQALIEISRVLNVQGQVFPSTLTDVTLAADIRIRDTDRVIRVQGESAITGANGRIERVFLLPDDVPAYPDATKAILSADLIVVSPGSLFTSILPNLLVQGIARAIRTSKAPCIYVCNVATQTGETDDFDVAAHVHAIEKHVGGKIFDIVVANDLFPPQEPDANFAFVRFEDSPGSEKLADKIVRAPLADAERPWRHNYDVLAQVIMDIVDDQGGETVAL